MKKLYIVLTIFVVLLLSSCAVSGKGDKNMPTGPASPTGNQEATNTPTPSPTSTPTPTPTPTLGPKSMKEVEEELKNVKVSLDDLMNEDVVYPKYFGAADENPTVAIGKRIAYFESFGFMSYGEARAFVTYINYCYLNSDSIDKDRAENILSVLDSRWGGEVHGFAYPIVNIMKYNYEHPDDQIVISWGAVDGAFDDDGRAVLNYIQQQLVEAMLKGSWYGMYRYVPDPEYKVSVVRSDGSLIQVEGLCDNLNVAAKNLIVGLLGDTYMTICDIYDDPGSPYKGIWMWNEREKQAQSFYDEYVDPIFPAFSDPEHANVRRHGFDANAYYEEDLQK